MYDADPEYTRGFYPNAISAVTVDGGMWAIPFISYIPIIFRNLTVLEAAGIDPNEGIPTFDAFIEQLAKVKAAGYDATHSWATGGYYCPGAIMAADAENITPGVSNGKTTVQAGQIVRTFETMKRINQYANAMTYGEDVTLEAFKTNKLAFILDGPWVEPGIAQSGVKYDVTLVPPYEAGGWTGGLQGWDFMYGTKSDDPVKDELVIKWLKKLGSYTSAKAWTMNVGRSTLRQDVMDDLEVINNTMMARVSSEGLKKGMQQMDFVHSAVFWPSAMGDIAPQVANGDFTPQQGAERFIQAVNNLYAEAGE
jgi:multiple sugar transport system substrate-binding protein